MTGVCAIIAVDTSESGDGELNINVTYDGRLMATTVNGHGPLYQVSFMPEGPGVYAIEVFFASMEVLGQFVLLFYRICCYFYEL